MDILLAWWVIVGCFSFWFLLDVWEWLNIWEKLLGILKGLLFALLIPFIVVKAVPFAQWFLTTIGA